jgi:hypothetical protein
MHAKEMAGDNALDPTEVVVRLHGGGVDGHRVAVEYATPLLDELQRAIKWIGSSIRRDLDETQIAEAKHSPRKRKGLGDATRLYLQPQFGAGSLIFHLTAAAVSEDDEGLFEAGSQDSLLDRSVQQLLRVVTEAQQDRGDNIGELTNEVRRLGSRAAAAMDRIAANVIKNEIDMDLTWNASHGARQTAKLRRRGALAINDAVQRNRVQTNTVDLVGLLETASVGKDLIRIETGDGRMYRMAVDPELGKRLGPLLNRRVAVRAEETVTWKNGGNEKRSYVLLAAEPEDQLDA